MVQYLKIGGDFKVTLNGPILSTFSLGLVWYFRQLRWPEEESEHTVTWAELAIDFVASTHCALQRDQHEKLNLEQQARLLRAAAKRVAHICKSAIVPDFDDSRMIPILTSLGLIRKSYRTQLQAEVSPTKGRP